MPPRFDEEARSLRLSVADLLDTEQLRTLGFANRGGFERMWLGQAIHSDYQEGAMEADPSYRREVPVCLELEHRGWRVEVHGRIDGIRRTEGGSLTVEEIKSVRPGAGLSPRTAEIYRRQALLYAWFLERETAEPVAAELILIEIGTGQIERVALEGDSAGLEVSVKRRLNALIAAHESESENRRRRQRAAETLEFPFYRPRPGQDTILDSVTAALEQREHLLVEAPTGIGKTVAALYPVLRHALKNDQRIFVLTAKTTQQEMACRVLELLNRDEAFHSLRLRAKSRMCANDELICHEEYCDYARDYYSRLQKSGVLPELLDRHTTLQPDEIFATARSAKVCPFEVSLELGQRVQVTVCDYNYAFAPHVALSDFGEDNDLGDTVLVIDEIHNLIDRGRGYYSPSLGSRRCRDIAGVAGELATHGGGEGGGTGASIAGRIEVLCKTLARLIESTVEEYLPPGAADGSLEAGLPEDELWRLRPEFDRTFVDYLEHRRETKSFRAEDPFVELYFDLLRFLDTLQRSHNESFSHCVQRERGESSIRILCLDASRFLGEVINRCHSVIGLSATLSPAEFYRDLLGFDPQRSSSLRVPSPFPPENRAVVIDTTVATTWRERAANYDRLAQRLGEFATAVPGNCLVLFPSYRFLTEVYERLPEMPRRVLVQQRADGETERQQILDTLRSALFSDVLLLAVAGGVFAEGVDYPGETLRAVAIVGPCLPTVSLDQKLLESYYEERFSRGFEYAFVIPGMTRVVQAAGRLIRSATDQGVIALFDKRFTHKLYARHLPEDWMTDSADADGGRPGGLSGHPASVAASFFAQLTEESEEIG